MSAPGSPKCLSAICQDTAATMTSETARLDQTGRGRPAAGQGASAAPAPSFACARAANTVERMICGDAELSALDRGIAIFYAAARRAPRHGRALREQREWLATRDACTARACLREEMMDRL